MSISNNNSKPLNPQNPNPPLTNLQNPPPHLHHQSLRSPSIPPSRPQFNPQQQQHQQQQQQRLPQHFHPQQQQHPQNILYPLASSGRGFIPQNLRTKTPNNDHLVTIANPSGGGGGGGFHPPPRAVSVFSSYPGRTFGYPMPPLSESQAIQRPGGVMMRPQYMMGARQMPPSFTSGGQFKSESVLGVPKAAPFPAPAPDFNGYKGARDIIKDDTVTIHDRKIALSDDSSLYALCRSWVRNGLPQENQVRFGEGRNNLPRPLPLSLEEDMHIQEENEDEEVEKKENCEVAGEKEEVLGSVEHLSAQDLLQGHVKRAKRVRARLREERHKRILRYKQRLALILPC